MKNLIILSILFTFLFVACEDCPTDDPPPIVDSPIADFNYKTFGNPIIADQTHVEFQNLSKGTITNSYWDFGQNEIVRVADGIENVDHVFDFAGTKEVALRVDGPKGIDEISQKIDVHAMNPNCNNYHNTVGEVSITYSNGPILFVRENNILDIGRIKVNNPYNEKIFVHVYHPDSWLNGNYQKFTRWDIAPLENIFLGFDGGYMTLGNDWGIQVESASGALGCIWSIHSLGYQINNGVYYVNLSKIYHGAPF